MARVSEVSKECEWGRGEGGPVLHQLPELSGLGSVICGRAVLEADEGLLRRNCEARIGISVVIGNPHLSIVGVGILVSNLRVAHIRAVALVKNKVPGNAIVALQQGVLVCIVDRADTKTNAIAGQRSVCILSGGIYSEAAISGGD